jgi:rubrerythrin
MHPLTEANLHNDCSGESMAHMRYLIYADQAEKEGFRQVARLFRAIAFAGKVHATNHFKRMDRKLSNALGEAPFGSGTTSQNLQYGIDGETFEIEEMYPVYREVAKFQGEKAAWLSFYYAWNTEMIHKRMFEEAKQLVDSGKDWKEAKVHVCTVCGFTGEGEAPDRCPFCGAKREAFKEFP